MIEDNEHDPEQDPEYFSDRDLKYLRWFVAAAVALTLTWCGLLIYVAVQLLS